MYKEIFLDNFLIFYKKFFILYNLIFFFFIIFFIIFYFYYIINRFHIKIKEILTIKISYNKYIGKYKRLLFKLFKIPSRNIRKYMEINCVQ